MSQKSPHVVNLLCALAGLAWMSACGKPKPLSFPFVQKYQVSPGDLFYFRADGQFVLLPRGKALDIAVSPAGWEAFAQPTKITISRPVEPKPGEFHGSRNAEATMESTPLADIASPMQHVAFSPAGGVLAGGGSDGTLRAWDLTTGSLLELHQPAGVLALAISPEGSTWAVGLATPTADASGTVRLLAYPSGITKGQFGTQPATALAYFTDGTLAAGFADGTVLHRSSDGETRTPPIQASPAAVTSIAVHPAGLAIASAHSDKQIYLWDPVTGQRIGTLLSDIPANPLFPRAIERVAFSGDGQRLGAAYSDGEMRIWDTTALTPKKK